MRLPNIRENPTPWVVGGAIAVMIVGTACASMQQPSESSTRPAASAAPDSATLVTTSSSTTTAATATPVPAAAVETTVPAVTPTPQQEALFATVAAALPSANAGDTAPSSGEYGGKANVQGYLQVVIKSANTTWDRFFNGHGLGWRGVTYDVTAGSDVYNSKCTAGVRPNHPRTVFCTADNKPDGAFALPEQTIRGLWSAPKADADLAAAMVASGEVGHLAVSSLRRQLNLPAISNPQRQLMATCLSGAWAHTAYPSGSLPTSQIRTALQAASKIGDEVDGAAVARIAGDEGLAAWRLGYITGNPGRCGQAYWR